MPDDGDLAHTQKIKKCKSPYRFNKYTQHNKKQHKKEQIWARYKKRR